MGTNLYFECQDHDPPISSWPQEVGQHMYDLKDARLMLADRSLLIDLANIMEEKGLDPYSTSGSVTYFANGLTFLRQHPNCKIGIRDEYQREHSIVDETRENTDE